MLVVVKSVLKGGGPVIRMGRCVDKFKGMVVYKKKKDFYRASVIQAGMDILIIFQSLIK